MSRNKEVEKLTEHAIDTTHYKVYCDFCDEQTSEEEYPSSAAEEAYDDGYRMCTLNNGEKYVACKKCFKNKEWKKWEEN